MFCPSCGKEIANAFGYCSFCGKPLTPPPQTAPGPAATAPAPVAMPGPAVAAAQAVAVSQTVNVGPKRNTALIAVIAIVVIAVIGGLVFLVANVNREPPDQRIGRLMREAAGLQPVRKQFFAKDQQFDDTFREQYKNLIQINKDYMEAVRKTDMSDVARLGTPESFADPASFADGLRELHTAYDLDSGQEQKLQEMITNLRNTIENSGWAASNREEFMKGFEQGVAQVHDKRTGIVSTERAWIDSIDDVYDYAQRNHAAFILSNGQLLIADNQVLEEFNAKVRKMNASRGQFMQAKQQFDQWQASQFQKMGVKASDIGATK